MQVYRMSGKPFVIIIDEWDCVVRNHADRPDLVHTYLQFLHSLFKSEESKKVTKKLNSYWKNTSAFDTINNYITLNFSGLKEDILTMLAGGSVPVNVNTFKNDLSVIGSKDEALTALIHLGYLGYNAVMEEAYVPNFEVSV